MHRVVRPIISAALASTVIARSASSPRRCLSQGPSPQQRAKLDALPRYFAHADALMREGKVNEARKAMEDAVSACRENKDALATASALSMLARIHISNDEVRSAFPLLHEAMELREKAQGRDNEDFARDTATLAYVWWQLCELDKAEALFRDSIALYTQTVGTDHASMAIAQYNLAGVLYEQGRKDEATQLGREALRVFTLVLGPDHSRTREARDNFGG